MDQDVTSHKMHVYYMYILFITFKVCWKQCRWAKISNLQTTLFYDTCHRDTYSPSKRICGEQEDHSFFTSQQSEFSSYQLQSLWVLHIANSLQRCSYVEQKRKARWFLLVKKKKSETLDPQRLLSHSCCYSSLWMFVARLSTWPDQREWRYSSLKPHVCCTLQGAVLTYDHPCS